MVVYMLSWLFTCSIIILHVHSTCPPVTSTKNLSIPLNVSDVDYGYNQRYKYIDCCVDGFKSLLWFFRKLNQPNWKFANLAIIYMDHNRTLIFKDPYEEIHGGYYLCTAEGFDGNLYKHKTFVYFLNINENRTIKIIKPQQSLPPKYNAGDNVNISCNGITYLPNEQVTITWVFKKNLRIIPFTRPHKVKNSQITAKDKPFESNPDLVEIESLLIIQDLKEDDSGIYICQMTQDDAEVTIGFQLSVIDDGINLLLIILLVISTIIIILLCILVWQFHYNIIFLYKSYFDPCPRGQCRDIDVSIMYDEMELNNLQLSIDLLISLEAEGFRCWHYDRDKTYGKDKVEEYAKCLHMSHVAVIILSSQSPTVCCLLMNLMKIIPDPAVRRLYVFNPTSKTILKLQNNLNPKIRNWLKKELRLQSIFRSNSINFDITKADKRCHNTLLKFIMSFIPSSAIRYAKDQTRKLVTNKF